MSQLYWFLGMLASIATALAPIAATVDEPYKTWLTIGGVAGTAITGYMMKPPRSVERRERWTDRAMSLPRYPSAHNSDRERRDH